MPNSFAFPKPPMAQSIMDKEGIMSPQWLRWFNQVFTQIQDAAYIPSSVDIVGGTVGGDTTINTAGPITTTAALHAALATIVGALVVGGALTVGGAAAIAGILSAANFSGSSSGANTGDQTIALSGDVIGSGVGPITTVGNGIDAVIVTAALTTLGTQGSMTFVKGRLTAQTPAT